jgi:glycosyltransferase involved in cell wall biosynthesis
VAEDVRRWGRGLKFFSKILVYNYLSASKIVNELVKKEGFKYDILVAHDWLSVITGVTAKRELGLPLVFHVHSTEKGRTLGNGSEVVSSIEYRGGQMADLVITVSNAMREELIELGFPKDKIQVCYNGVDPNKYSLQQVNPEKRKEIRERYGLTDDDEMVLFIGRLVGVKGVDKLIMAIPHVLQKVSNAKFVIVGLGGMEDHLKNMVKGLKLEEAVKFRFEFVPEEERIAHYAACDLAVFPSLYEPFGIVALEAMSMEKPVVVGAAGVSGMREIVVSSGSGQCGFHVNPNEPVDIAWGIVSCLQNQDRKQELGKNGRKRVLAEFTWEAIAKKTLATYQEMLNQKKKD